MPEFLRAVIRIGLGLLGLSWLLGGGLGVVIYASNHEWGAAAGSAIGGLAGYCLAYGAFVRAPWESPARIDDEAA